MKDELEIVIVYNHNNTIRCIYLDDTRIYGSKPYASEGLRHDFAKVKTATIHDISDTHRLRQGGKVI
jgi:hypothetical protein